MDTELKCLLAITRNLPKIRGMGKVGCRIRDYYARKRRPLVEACTGAGRLTLNPNDSIEGELLFHPHLYEREERQFLMSQLEAGDTFLDAGAHLGFYSIEAAKRVGPLGNVVAIEAHPSTFARLQEHFNKNNLDNCQAVHRGLADCSAELEMNQQTGNSGASSFIVKRDAAAIRVRCEPLEDVLSDLGIKTIKAAKFDLEGFEYRVLKRLLAEAPTTLWPRYILVEYFAELEGASGGHIGRLLGQHGYKVAWQRPPRPNTVYFLSN